MFPEDRTVSRNIWEKFEWKVELNMGLVEKRYFKIPLEELKGIDEIFFRQIQMDGDKVLKKFKNLFEGNKKRWCIPDLPAKGFVSLLKLKT